MIYNVIHTDVWHLGVPQFAGYYQCTEKSEKLRSVITAYWDGERWLAECPGPEDKPHVLLHIIAYTQLPEPYQG